MSVSAACDRPRPPQPPAPTAGGFLWFFPGTPPSTRDKPKINIILYLVNTTENKD